MTRAVAYLRVSTEDQHLGPEAQRAQIERWAAVEGVEVVAWHQDKLSGGLAASARPGLQEAVRATQEGQAEVLVVAKRDRLARDRVEAGLLDRAVRVVSADGVGRGTSAADVLARGMQDVFAEYERLVIKERTRAALAAKRARGERTGSLPFGYREAAGKLVEHEGEQGALARITALRREGTSMRRIVDLLNTSGETCRGARWHLTTVARLLSRGGTDAQPQGGQGRA